MPNRLLRDKVYAIVARIPKGRVTTYGDIAAVAGHPYAARVVGRIAHFGPSKLPWHRVVNRSGSMARGFWGGMEIHAQLLKQEGIKVINYKIENFEDIRWREITSLQL
ncbi:MAG TPA: methylated-DNA--[protein]-cysteine S-methyltransferase [Verrucomicrobiae bacterium]|nr:methylated-DNA--[protein]-cysteine S-methyltransferase [Verrucomicrobiae bacterium]